MFSYSLDSFSLLKILLSVTQIQPWMKNYISIIKNNNLYLLSAITDNTESRTTYRHNPQ
jgi:hypothetical protein